MPIMFRRALVLVEVRWEERVNRAVHIADLGVTPRVQEAIGTRVAAVSYMVSLVHRLRIIVFC